MLQLKSDVGLHEYELAPDADKPTVLPLQIDVSIPASTINEDVIVMITESSVVQNPFVTVTIYVVVAVAVAIGLEHVSQLKLTFGDHA